LLLVILTQLPLALVALKPQQQMVAMAPIQYSILLLQLVAVVVVLVILDLLDLD
jgi:hypothetical protein